MVTLSTNACAVRFLM